MSQTQEAVTALLVRAEEARRGGVRAEELRLLEQALQLAPGDPRVLNARGMCALAAEDFQVARASFRAAAENDPGAPPLWINLAKACRALNDDAGEQAALERVIALDQRHFVAQLRMAELHTRLERRAQAALAWSAVVQMALQLKPRPPLVEEALASGQAFLAEHRKELADRVEAEFGPELQVEERNARRFAACMDHALGKRALYVNQCAGLHYPFLPADEFFDREHFPWLIELESRTDAIRAELQALLQDGDAGFRPYVRQDAGTPENKWSKLDQSLNWGAYFLWEYGRRYDDACARCPATAAAIEAVPKAEMPGRAPSVFFSLLRPRTRIPAHTGVTNTRTIIHLPLIVPNSCGFRVGGTTRAWRVGEAFAFDDTIEHEAWNDSDELRAVLIFDVWNPHLDADERRMISRFFAIADEAGERESTSWRP